MFTGSSTAVVVCRGQSLRLLHKLANSINNNESFDVYFVNRFRELADNVDALDLVKRSKNNYHYINNEIINLETKETYQIFSINEIQSNKKKSDIDAPIFLLSNFYFSGNISHIPEDVPDNRYKLISSGLGCTAFCTTKNNYKQIITIGLDFFESNYLHYHVHTGKKQVKDYQPRKGKDSKLQFLELVRSTPDVQFFLYTAANMIDFDIPENLSIVYDPVIT